MDVTPRREYREHILFLEAERDSLAEEAEYAKGQKNEWFNKYVEIKQAKDALSKAKDAQSEQLASVRAKLAKQEDEIRNLNAFIEKLKKDVSAAQDKLEESEARAQQLAREKKSAELDAESQKKAYVELAHDYDLLKGDYDNLRVSVATANGNDACDAAVTDEEISGEQPAIEAEDLFDFQQLSDSQVSITDVQLEGYGVEASSEAGESFLSSSGMAPKKKSKKHRG